MSMGFSSYSQAVDSSNKTSLDPIIFLDEVQISNEDMQKIDPNDLAAIEVLKDSSAIKALGEEGKNGVIYITSINHAREKYIQFFRSKSSDYAGVINSTMDEDNVVYVLNGKILGKENAGDLYLINDDSFLNLRILNKTELEREYNIFNKECGIIIVSKIKDKN